MVPQQDRETRPPGLGERIAMSGYSPQYAWATQLILRHLRNRELIAIRVADPNAGTLDDLQIETSNAVLAYQFKHVQPGSPFTYGDFRSEIHGLRDAITRLNRREAGSGRTVRAHLWTNGEPANQRGISPLGEPRPDPAHFQAFVDTVWRPASTRRISLVDEVVPGFRPTWSDLADRAGADDESLFELAAQLELNFGNEVPSGVPADHAVDNQLASAYDTLVRFLVSTVGDMTQRVVRIEREELLTRLGWQDSFSTYASQELRLERERYAPNSAVMGQLRAALAEHEGGYVALMGLPGTGKSYLLTDMAEERDDEVVARYYAYLRGSRETAEARASAEAFLHDLVVQLETAGARVGETAPTTDIHSLRARLRRQLEILSERGGRSIIVVDGLDYAHRVGQSGGSPSLLAELPDPAALGSVTFILGTQHLTGAPPAVVSHLATPGRTIEMRPMDMPTVMRVIERSGLDLDPQTAEAIVTRAGGNPLVLGTLLAGAANETESDRGEWIASQPALSEGLDHLYDQYWLAASADPNVTDLLARMARWRSSLDPIWLAGGDTAAVQRLRAVRHLFRREREDRWFFFHESFRIFLLERTVADIGGSALARRYHESLADLCAVADPTDIRRYEELHHRLAANQEEAAIQLATPEWFRRQTYLFRSPRAIAADIRAVVSHLVRTQDPVALTRLTIAESELHTRDDHLDWSAPLAPVLIEAGLADQVIDGLSSDRELLVGKHIALMSIEPLYRQGRIEQARSLFELAEPRELFTEHPPRTTRPSLHADALFAWADVVHLFRDVEHIMSSIDRTTAEAFDLHGHDDVLGWRRNELRSIVARNFDAADDMERAAAMLAAMSDDEAGRTWNWYTQITIAHRRADVERLIQLAGEPNLPEMSNARLRAVRALIDHGEIESARVLLADIPRPDMSDPVHEVDPGITPFERLITYARFHTVTGDCGEPELLIPDGERFYRLWVRGLRDVVRIAQFLGRLDKGEDLGADEATQLLGSIANLGSGATRHDYGRAALVSARGGLFALVADAIHAEAAETRRVCAEFFANRFDPERMWSSVVSETPRTLWSLVQAGLLSSRQATQALEAADQAVLVRRDTSSTIEALLRHAHLWLQFGRAEKAREVLTNALDASHSVGFRKDFQLDAWLELAKPIFLNPDGEPFARWLAEALVALENSTEGDAGRSAADCLLEMLVEFPASLVQVTARLSDSDVLPWEAALATALATLTADDVPEDLVWELTRVLVHISRSAYPAVFDPLFSATADIEGRLLEFVEVLAVDPLPSTRRNWKAALEPYVPSSGVARVALDELCVQVEPTWRSGGSSYSIPAASIEDALALDPSSSDVAASIRRWAPEMTHAETQSAASRFSANELRAIEPLSKRFLELGDRAAAIALLTDGIQAGEPLSWTHMYGAEKLRLCEVLADVEGHAFAASLLWPALVSDIQANTYLLGMLRGPLSRILEILDPDEDVRRQIAAEAHQYLRALLEKHVDDDEVPEAPSNLDRADSLRGLLALLVFSYDPLRREAASIASTRAIASGDLALAQVIFERSVQADELTRALTMFDAAGWTPPAHVIEAWRAQVQEDELDTEYLDGWVAREDWTLTQDFEVKALLTTPQRRPTEVVPMATDDDGRTWSRERFEANVPDPALVNVSRVDGWQVVAEHSVLRRLEWERPTEIRTSKLIGTDGTALVSVEWSGAWRGSRVQVVDELTASLSPAGDPAGGWTFTDGDPALIIIRWADGSLRQEPPSFEDEVGEGVLVLASPRFAGSLHVETCIEIAANRRWQQELVGERTARFVLEVD